MDEQEKDVELQDKVGNALIGICDTKNKQIECHCAEIARHELRRSDRISLWVLFEQAYIGFGPLVFAEPDFDVLPAAACPPFTIQGC